MIEPISVAFTSSWRPLPRAKRAMISSGALPNVTLSSPPIPGPDCDASSSVARPMRAAVGMIPSAEQTKITASLPFARSSRIAPGMKGTSRYGQPCEPKKKLASRRGVCASGACIHPAYSASAPPDPAAISRPQGPSLDSARVRTRRFGDTDLEASEIGFGTWALGSTWWGDVSESDGERLLNQALELGITFFETGDAYGQGANEELVGRVLGPHRDHIQLSTKFGYVLDSGRQQHSEGERPQRWDGAFVREALEGSLRRLATDHVDLYQLHNPRMDAIDSDSCFETLEELRSEGKVRHYGVALGPAIGWRDEGLRATATRDIASVQTVYNLLEQDPGRDLMAASAEHGVGVMARVPTSSGLLDGNLTPDTTFGPGDHRRHRPREWLVEGLQKIDRCRFLCGPGAGGTMAQASLRFILAQPQMAVVIPTITNEAELREYAGATDVPELSTEELAQLDDLYARNFDVERVGTASG